MSEAYQRVIFDPFTREQENVWNQIQGTGLGMAITKNLVDLMGGTIRVSSQLGRAAHSPLSWSSGSRSGRRIPASGNSTAFHA